MLCLLFRTFPLVHFVRINNVHLTVNVNDALCSKCLTDESLSSFMTVVFFLLRRNRNIRIGKQKIEQTLQ